MISLTQTRLWADLNSHYNKLEPKIIKGFNVSCLFGYSQQNASWTSFNGPMVSSQTTCQDFLNFLLLLLERAKEEKILQINFRSLPPLREWHPSFEEHFHNLSFVHQEWKTLIINLSFSQETLLKNLKHSARKGIKKAEALGVNTHRCDTFDQYFSGFLLPYLEVTKRPKKSREFYKAGWDLDSDRHYGYWIAKNSQGDCLGFLGSYRYDGLATEIMSALTPRAVKEKIPVQDMLHWEAIRHHKKLGDLYFDLAGFNPNPVSEKEKNIKRFKEKWGGKEYDVSTYCLDNRSMGQKIISRLKRMVYE